MPAPINYEAQATFYKMEQVTNKVYFFSPGHVVWIGMYSVQYHDMNIRHNFCCARILERQF